MFPSRMIKAALLLGAVGPLAAADVGMAQYVPYARYGGSYGWGAYPSPSAAVIPRGVVAAQKGADRRQQLGQTYAQHQATNAFLAGQAQRSSAWVGENQKAVDQFRMMQLEQQSRQFAARAERAGQVAAAAPLPGLPAVPPTASVPSDQSQSAAQDGKTRWPTLLRDPRFAQPREKLDKMLGPEGVRPGLTSAEYEEIIAAADQMKRILRGMASELNAAEYLAVGDFLDDLIARAKAAMNPGQ